MLCRSLFPTFTPSNFVRVIDSSVPCALAFWLCFVTPHLYQLASRQLGGLSNLKEKKKQNQLPWVLYDIVSLYGVPSAPIQAMHWCLSQCSVQFIQDVPRQQWGLRAGQDWHTRV